ncbi:hypothetical protein [Marinospirillum minutulum]|uniref:hypothetical protein n=1 Tax=Marinospirillum minutulum TaxID=64974 RepID=UPI0003FF6E09|nr:hypothetical protein [Marinospirillum minutulum]
MDIKFLNPLAKPASDLLIEGMKQLGRVQGVVHDAFEAEVAGEKGFIVWDSIIMNEVYFMPNDNKLTIQSFLITMACTGQAQVDTFN